MGVFNYFIPILKANRLNLLLSSHYLGALYDNKPNRPGQLHPILYSQNLLGLFHNKVHCFVPTLQLAAHFPASAELNYDRLALKFSQLDERFFGYSYGEAQICHIYYNLFDYMLERQHRSTGRCSETIASFLLKTYEILQHPENKKIICWDKDDIGFIVIDVVSFTREILPKYFRHSNFSSFVRQLNMYDFHKVKQDNEMLVFKNPLFCRGEQHKLRFIKRKAAKKIPGHKRPQHQKTTTAYKWLKKAIQSEINHSCAFLEKSIDLVSQNNTSVGYKQLRVNEIAQSDNRMGKIDCLYQLRQQCQAQISRTLKWSEEYIELVKRKLKTVNNYNLQALQCKKEEEKGEELKSMADIN